MKMHAMSGSLLVLLACDLEAEEAAGEPQEDVSQSGVSASSALAFHAEVGAPIDAVTGNQWIENYRRTTGREPPSFTIPSATLKRILAVPGGVGISMRLGTDEAGGVHVFPRAVDQAGRVLFDPVAHDDAERAMLDRYSEPVRTHFFGRNTFTRLLDDGRCEDVRATLALDDALAPQLLLSDASQKEPRSYEDRSFPVPPDSPQSQEF